LKGTRIKDRKNEKLGEKQNRRQMRTWEKKIKNKREGMQRYIFS